MAEFSFSSYSGPAAATSPGWALDPFLSLESLANSSFSFPGTPSAGAYLNDAEESRLLASLTAPTTEQHSSFDRMMQAKSSQEGALTAALLLKLEREADPFDPLDFRGPVAGCNYDTVPTACHPSASDTTRPATTTVGLHEPNYDAMSDATLEDENLSAWSAHAVPHSPDQCGFDELFYNCSESTPESGASTPTATRRRAATFSKTKRRYPRSHTCREPERAEFSSEEDFQSAWNTWRQIRNCNNEAVRRSRNSKKTLLSCKSESCTAMSRKLKAAEKIKELLLKAACAPHSLSRTESIAYNKLIASRVEYVSLSTGTSISSQDAEPMMLAPPNQL